MPKYLHIFLHINIPIHSKNKSNLNEKHITAHTKRIIEHCVKEKKLFEEKFIERKTGISNKFACSDRATICLYVSTKKHVKIKTYWFYLICIYLEMEFCVFGTITISCWHYTSPLLYIFLNIYFCIAYKITETGAN